MPNEQKPDLSAEQADLIFGPAAENPAEQAELKAFLTDALADYRRQIDELLATQGGLTPEAGRRACHALNGSLRTLGLEGAGLRMRDLEDHWADFTAESRADAIESARTAIVRGVDALRAVYPWLA